MPEPSIRVCPIVDLQHVGGARLLWTAYVDTTTGRDRASGPALTPDDAAVRLYHERPETAGLLVDLSDVAALEADARATLARLGVSVRD